MIGLHDAEPIASPEPRPSPHEHVLARRALSILIVAHDSAEHIDAQLAMLAMAARYRDWQVIVVDNASSDGTAELVESRHPWALLIRSPVNIGYAAACNLAAREALGALLLLAHPDTHAQPAMIARAAARMLVNPGVGIAGGRLVDAEGQDVPASHRFPSALGDAFAWRGPVWPGAAAKRVPLDPDLQPREPARRVDWVSDAFAIMRHDLFRFLGGFDPRFFMYCEDIDLCRRVAMEGFSVMCWPDVRALRAGRRRGARRRGGRGAPRALADAQPPALSPQAPGIDRGLDRQPRGIGLAHAGGLGLSLRRRAAGRRRRASRCADAARPGRGCLARHRRRPRLAAGAVALSLGLGRLGRTRRPISTGNQEIEEPGGIECAAAFTDLRAPA
ncbi:glycosyltransferase [Burkholderia gladioli]|uniref:glycosyltransferase n=2 Tax=Burkholderia gladioli TaxID=28095 RepID=UPI0021B486A7|nr:glycosyltransferase [Burkholderia gladioli]